MLFSSRFKIPKKFIQKKLEESGYGKEAPQNLFAERATIAQEQGASEHTNFGEKPTPPETNSSGFFGIMGLNKIIELISKRFVKQKGVVSMKRIEKRKTTKLTTKDTNLKKQIIENKLDKPEEAPNPPAASSQEKLR